MFWPISWAIYLKYANHSILHKTAAFEPYLASSDINEGKIMEKD